MYICIYISGLYPSSFADLRFSNMHQQVGLCNWGFRGGGALSPLEGISVIPGFQIAFPCIIW